MTTIIATPESEKYTLVATVPQIVGGHLAPITVHIPTGTSADVYTTCSTNAEINANTADWIEWPNGVKAGPFMDALLHNVTGIKLLSAAGGTVYLVRG